jgi:hypothetical protein
MGSTDQRISPSETRYTAEDVRAFITEALDTEPAVGRVQELLVAHIHGKRYHPSVVQETLVGLIGDIVGAATHEDWTAITSGLITDAREALIDDEPETVSAR